MNTSTSPCGAVCGCCATCEHVCTFDRSHDGPCDWWAGTPEPAPMTDAEWDAKCARIADGLASSLTRAVLKRKGR